MGMRGLVLCVRWIVWVMFFIMMVVFMVFFVLVLIVNGLWLCISMVWEW